MHPGPHINQSALKSPGIFRSVLHEIAKSIFFSEVLVYLYLCLPIWSEFQKQTKIFTFNKDSYESFQSSSKPLLLKTNCYSLENKNLNSKEWSGALVLGEKLFFYKEGKIDGEGTDTPYIYNSGFGEKCS